MTDGDRFRRLYRVLLGENVTLTHPKWCVEVNSDHLLFFCPFIGSCSIFSKKYFVFVKEKKMQFCAKGGCYQSILNTKHYNRFLNGQKASNLSSNVRHFVGRYAELHDIFAYYESPGPKCQICCIACCLRCFVATRSFLYLQFVKQCQSDSVALHWKQIFLLIYSSIRFVNIIDLAQNL